MKISMHFVGLAASWTLFATSATAVTVGQTDDFQNGTRLNWAGGASPTNISTGGPLGTGDRWLRMTSTGGFGQGSQMATYNDFQWAGNYITAGVRMIECDMKNLGFTDLHMRLVMFSQGFSRYTSVEPIILPAGQDWVRCYFPLREEDLVIVEGDETYAQALATIFRAMFRHNTVPQPTGEPIAAVLGIDNIIASAGWRITGNLNLEGLAVAPPPSVMFEYRTPGTQTVVYRCRATVDANGNYIVYSPPNPGAYDVSVKVTHWLRRTVNIPSTNGDITGFDLLLLNGDVDDDNEVTIGDYAQLSSAFGSSPGDPNWNAMADLDGDDEVTIGDFSLLSNNFGEVGDD
jgi:hypothetical protein